MKYRTPRHWRWWLTIGINPQARHDTTHYIRRDNAGFIALMAEWRRRLDELGHRPLPEMQPWQRDVFAAVLAAHPSTIGRLTHPNIRPGRRLPDHLIDQLEHPRADIAHLFGMRFFADPNMPEGTILAVDTEALKHIDLDRPPITIIDEIIPPYTEIKASDLTGIRFITNGDA